MLVNGKWTANWQPVQATDAKGGFVRQTSSFRHWITPDTVRGTFHGDNTGLADVESYGFGRMCELLGFPDAWEFERRWSERAASIGSTGDGGHRKLERETI